MVFPLSINNRIEGIVNIDKPLNTNSLEITTKIKKKTRKKKIFSKSFLDKESSGCLLVYFQKSKFQFSSIIENSFKILTLISTEFNCIKGNNIMVKYLKGNFYQSINYNMNKRKFKLQNIRCSLVNSIDWYKGKIVCFFNINADDFDNFKISLNFNLGLIFRKNCFVNENRRINVGVITENENLIVFQDLIDILWNLNFWKNFNNFQKLLIPIPFVLRHLKKIVVKDSAINSICYGSNLMSNGILATEEDIPKGQRVILVTKKKEIIALGEMCYSIEILFKNYQIKAVVIKNVLMKKNVYSKKWGFGYNNSLKKINNSIKTSYKLIPGGFSYFLK